jgi:hypothetical protein
MRSKGKRLTGLARVRVAGGELRLWNRMVRQLW